jgi:hypothetical protein
MSNQKPGKTHSVNLKGSEKWFIYPNQVRVLNNYFELGEQSARDQGMT